MNASKVIDEKLASLNDWRGERLKASITAKKPAAKKPAIKKKRT